jgi:hypothetical protein
LICQDFSNILRGFTPNGGDWTGAHDPVIALDHAQNNRFRVRRDVLTEFPARIPFESFSGLRPTSTDPNAFGVGRDPAWGWRRREVQRVERPAAGECQRGDKQPANGQQGGPRPEPLSRRAPDDAA